MAYGLGSIIVILGMLLGGGQVPKDFLALVPSKALLEGMGQKIDEDSLIANLASQGAQVSNFDQSKVDDAIQLIRKGNYKERKKGRLVLKENLAEIGDLLKKLQDDDDPEISEYALELLADYKKLKADEKQKAKSEGSLKLLSVRALADMKSKKAVATLKSLIKSSDESLAYEAKRALSIISGEELAKSNHEENLKSALEYIPQDTAILASLDLTGETDIETLEQLFEYASKKQPMLSQMKDQILSGANAALPEVISNFGSGRIDTVVLAVGEGAGDRERWDVSFTLKGWYDMDRFKSFLSQNQRARFKDWKFNTYKGEVYMGDSEVAIWLIDNNTLSFIISDRSRQEIFQSYFNKQESSKTQLSKLLDAHKKSDAKLAAVGQFAESQVTMFRKEINRELTRMEKRNHRPETDFLSKMLKLYDLALDNTGMSGSSSTKGLSLNFFFDKEKASKAVSQVKAFDKAFRDFLGPQLDRMKNRGRGPEINLDLSQEIFKAQQTDKGVELNLKEDIFMNFFMMTMVF